MPTTAALRPIGRSPHQLGFPRLREPPPLDQGEEQNQSAALYDHGDGKCTEASFGSPTVISCSKLFLQEGGKGVNILLDNIIPAKSEVPAASADTVQSSKECLCSDAKPITHSCIETKISEDNRSFSFAVGALPDLSEKVQSTDWIPFPGSKAVPNTEDVTGNCPHGNSMKNTSEDSRRTSFVETGKKLPMERQVDKIQGRPIVSSASDDISKMTSVLSEIQQHPTPENSTLAHQPFTSGQHAQLLAQILVHADLVQGKPPAEATMVRAFGQPGGHKHDWEEALRAAVNRLQNQKSPGLETPYSSRIGSFTAEQGSNDTAVGKTMFGEPHSSKTYPNSLQHDSGEKVSQGLDDGGSRIQSVKKDHGHDELTLQTAGVLPSVSCNEAIRGDKCETNHPPENTTEHTKMFEQRNGDKAHLEVGCANKVNQKLYDDGKILKKITVCGGQTALESHCCSVALHDKSSEANSLYEKNTGKNTADIQISCCSRSIPNSLWDGNEEGAKRASNKKITGNTVVETSHVHCSDNGFSGFAAACLLSVTDNTPFCTQDKNTNSSIEGLTEQDVCVKCGKDGQLLNCSSCFLAAHDSCFGSSVTFDDSGQLHCPVCSYNKTAEAYKKAKKAYSEARKNLSAFLGTRQFAKQCDEQSTGKQQRAANSEDNTSKRQANHQSEADNLYHKDEEPGQQKTNATSDACPEKVVAEKASCGPHSDVAPMNKQFVLQNKRKQVRVAEHEPPVENAEAHEEDGNGNSSHEAQHSSQNRCSPVANQNVEADCKNSDEIEDTSWQNMRHHKARFQEKETSVLNNSEKALGHQGQYIPSPSRKRYYAYPPEHCCNPLTPTRRSLAPTRTPVASTARRAMLLWTEGEVAALREAVAEFTRKNKGQISWVQIRENGRDVFHKARRPDDLRMKWNNMKKKSGSGEMEEQEENFITNACPEEVVTEKASCGPHSDVAPMNKHFVLQNKRKQAHVAEHEPPVQNAEAHEEDGNGNSSHEAQHSSQNRCSPVANQNVEAGCENSDEIEATSWRNMRHHKARFQEKETSVLNNSEKVLGRQDQYMPSPSRKRYYAYPPEHCCNPLTPTRRPLAPSRTPVASTARRARLLWTEGEVAALREAVAEFTRKNKGQISWVQIRENGRDVFHKARRPDDLRMKWNNMKKKSVSGEMEEQEEKIRLLRNAGF